MWSPAGRAKSAISIFTFAGGPSGGFETQLGDVFSGVFWISRENDECTRRASGKHYRLCLTVAGMGDANTVDITTAIHENVLKDADVLHSDLQSATGKLCRLVAST